MAGAAGAGVLVAGDPRRRRRRSTPRSRRRARSGSSSGSPAPGRAPAASDHPQYSFAAIGPAAEGITAEHALDSGFGERSPLARLHDLDGDVLLLGAGHGSNASLHLAEYGVPDPPREAYGAAVMGPDGRRWATWEDVVADESDFAALGAAFDATGAVTIGRVGVGEARLMRQRELVAFAVGWLVANRRR